MRSVFVFMFWLGSRRYCLLSSLDYAAQVRLHPLGPLADKTLWAQGRQLVTIPINWPKAVNSLKCLIYLPVRWPKVVNSLKCLI